MSTENPADLSAAALRLDEELRAYDWQIFTRTDGSFAKGAIGRTKTRERSRERVAEALAELPDHVRAHGEVLRTNVMDPNVLALVEVAVRTRDGSIDWTQI